MSNTPIAPIPTPDPWIIHHNNTYYFTFTLGSHIEVWSSPSLEDFHNPNTTQKSTIWRPSPSAHWSTDIWAPELHYINNAWYIYTCAAPASVGNPGHRTVLLHSTHPDPLNASSWSFLGPLKGLPEDQWSIDATIFTLPPLQPTFPPRLYCIYSGWPPGDHSDTQQDLFLAELSSPDTAIPSSLTCISRASLAWERPENGRRGVNEGPSFLSIPPSPALPSGFQGVVFSAHASWGPDYKLGVLTLVDPSNPCRELSWRKRDTPLLVSDGREGPPFGPGHASFVRHCAGVDGVWCVYHATGDVHDGWNNRFARVLRLYEGCFAWDAKPVCCARLRQGEKGGGGQNVSNSMSDGRGSGVSDRIWGEIEKRAPEQYKGYLGKVKKWF